MLIHAITTAALTAVICSAWTITVTRVIAHDEQRYASRPPRRPAGAHRAAR